MVMWFSLSESTGSCVSGYREFETLSLRSEKLGAPVMSSPTKRSERQLQLTRIFSKLSLSAHFEPLKVTRNHQSTRKPSGNTNPGPEFLFTFAALSAWLLLCTFSFVVIYALQYRAVAVIRTEPNKAQYLMSSKLRIFFNA